MISPSTTIFICYIVLTVGTYAVWPSRWNILAHMHAAFCVIAYLIPIVFLGQERSFSPDILRALAGIMTTGTIAYILGMIFGGFVAGRKPTRRAAARAMNFDAFTEGRSANRLVIALLLGIGLTVVAAVFMGGLPLFSANPLDAKYFRGDIKEKYDQVSVLYRLGTGILTVLPPISVAWAIQDRRRRLLWALLSGAALFLMLATLQRGPMAEGLLLVIGVFLVWKRRYLLMLATILGTYVIGALFYTVLSLLGVSGVQLSGSSSDSNFLEQVAATAPDVTDTLSFLQAWIAQGEPHTYGLTMWGGLVPGRSPWNPAVWSLVTQNYGANIDTISSGGLRLPLPLWGAINFGDAGTILVPLAAGVIAGFAVRKIANIVPTASAAGTTIATVTLSTVLLTIGSFYVIGYLEIVKAAVLIWVLFPCLRVASGLKARMDHGQIRRAKGHPFQKSAPERRQRLPLTVERTVRS